MDKIRVVLAEDHHVVRAALASFLASEADIEIAGEVADAATLIDVVKQIKPHVLVLDAHMPGHRVIEMAYTLRAQCPEVQILVLSAYCRREYVAGFLDAGAVGYVLKDDPQETLIQAVRAAAQGQQWLSPHVTEMLLKSTGNLDPKPVDKLTRRETEVLRLMACGHTNVQIAEILNVTEQTVKNHARNIFSKLGAETRVAAVLHIINQDLENSDWPNL